MYNDFKLISENEILKLKNAYNERLNKITAQNLEFNFLEKIENLISNLKKTLHHLENLINFSKNVEEKDLFINLKTEIENNIENLKNIYDFNEVKDKNYENKKIDNEINININIKNVNDLLLCFVEGIYDLIKFENNIKIKTVLDKILLTTIKELKSINTMIKISSNLKVFSLFKFKY